MHPPRPPTKAFPRLNNKFTPLQPRQSYEDAPAAVLAAGRETQEGSSQFLPAAAAAVAVAAKPPPQDPHPEQAVKGVPLTAVTKHNDLTAACLVSMTTAAAAGQK
eukprot:1157366-Pelagomonas_calceolata.AAC.1